MKRTVKPIRNKCCILRSNCQIFWFIETDLFIPFIYPCNVTFIRKVAILLSQQPSFIVFMSTTQILSEKVTIHHGHLNKHFLLLSYSQTCLILEVFIEFSLNLDRIYLSVILSFSYWFKRITFSSLVLSQSLKVSDSVRPTTISLFLFICIPRVLSGEND